MYTEKLLVPVKPSTVRKFRRLYGDSAPGEAGEYIQVVKWILIV